MWYTNIAKFTTLWSQQVSNEMKQENLLNEMGFQNGDPQFAYPSSFECYIRPSSIHVFYRSL